MFQTLKPLLATLAALSIALPAQVDAHGTMLIPKVTFLDPYNRNAPAAMVPGPAGPYTGNAVIKDLAEANGSKCGKTDANAPVQPIPAGGVVQLQITAAHIGPCELWLDNEKVASAKECVKEYPDRTIRVDFSKCKSSKCQLRWVWLATHNSPWEMYDNCVNVGGSGSGSDNGPVVAPSTPSMTPAPGPAPATTPVPSQSTKKPSASTPVPSQSTKKPSQPSQPSTPSAAPPASDSDASGTVLPAPVGDGKYRGIDGSAALNWWCEINCERGFCPEEKCVTV